VQQLFVEARSFTERSCPQSRKCLQGSFSIR
jgi:hypothetical protein